jgi:nitrate/TMAO reductase-like tetraheme cytochrome c subunit
MKLKEKIIRNKFMANYNFMSKIKDMKLRFVWSSFLVVLLFLTANSFAVDKTSELSKVMRQMLDYIKAEKTNISNNLPAQPMPKSFQKIYTAKVTSGKKLLNNHEQYAKESLTLLNTYIDKKEMAERQKTFNLAVESCIACHELVCPGPIATIRQNIIK